MKKISLTEIIEAISNLNLIEISTLIKEFELKFNINSNVKQENVIIKEKFDIYLKEIGDKKINLIKTIKEITNLSLKESKELVENKNKPIKKNISKNECEEIKKKITILGASVEIK